MPTLENMETRALSNSGKRSLSFMRPDPRTLVSMSPDDVYITRKADAELVQALLRGEFCYVLGPPRSGKTLLRLHTARTLASLGIQCTTVDLTRMGPRVRPEGWYYALMGQMADGLQLPDPTEFWTRHEDLAPAARFAAYLRDEVLTWISRPVVVFIDELDAMRALGADADDFVSALRALLVDRSRDRSLRRLSFCLIGSAAPSSILRDPQPLLELGRRVSVPDFTSEEAQGLLRLIDTATDGGDESQRVLKRILRWTGGHPYLTLQVCKAQGPQSESGIFGDAEERTDQLIGRLFDGGDDPYLRLVGQRFDQILPEGVRVQALSLYRRLLYGERIPCQPDDQAQRELLLLGLITERQDDDGYTWLRVRNRIFERVFSKEWVADKGQGRLLSGLVIRWLQSGRSHEHVLRGKDLDEVLSWAVPGGKNTTPDEAEFLRAGLVLRQEEELRLLRDQLEAERRAHADERALRQRQRSLALTLSALSALSVAGGGAALWLKARRADQHSIDATLQAQRQAAQAEKEREAAVRARSLLGYSAWKLTEVAYPTAGTPAAPGTSGAAPQAQWQAKLTEELTEAGVAPLRRRLDGLTALALSRHQEGRGAALLLGIGTLGESQQVQAEPPQEALRAVYGVVADALTEARDTPGYPLLRGHGGQVRAAAFSPIPAAGLLATASDDQTARIWDVRAGKLVAVLGPARDYVRGVVFSPDGKLVATYGNDSLVQVYRLQPASHEAPLQAALRGHTAEVRAAAFISGEPGGPTGPSGARPRLLTAGGDGTARIWDPVSGNQVAVLRGHGQAILALAVSPDGKLVATGGQDRTAVIWNTETHKALWTLRGHEGEVRALAFSPSSRLLVTASADRTARLWDTGSGAPHGAGILRGHEDGLTSAVFSPDGQRVLTASSDRTARLWDTDTGVPVRTLRGHFGAVYGAVFSPGGAQRDSGRQILTFSADHTALLHDGQSGEMLASLRGHSGAVYAAAFSPDGEAIVTASGDRGARIYPASPGAFLHLGCEMVKDLPDFDRVRHLCGPNVALSPRPGSGLY